MDSHFSLTAETVDGGQSDIFSVSQITAEIKALLDGAFPAVWVEGEISNFTHHFASGHMYFTLKDEKAELRAAMFRGYNEHLKFPVENGMMVLANGDISVYEARGQYQLLVRRMEPAGVGTLYLAFEALKKKLEGEGLFDESRKQSLPPYPFRIGIVTSGSGATIQDIRNVLSRRAPHLELILRPTLVQGNAAAEDIISAIGELEKIGDLDCIIVGRGGGSLEDLWAFNEEKVVRRIAAATVPIISAIGHETDLTLSDFSADLRAPTPSTAAELVSPALSDIRSGLDEVAWRLGEGLKNRVQSSWQQLDGQVSRYGFQQPRVLLERGTEYLNETAERLARNVRVILAMKNANHGSVSGRLSAVNPTAILERGYAIPYTLPDKRNLKSVRGVKKGDRFSLHLSDGKLESEVKKISKDRK
ncbi:MAG TPA: exodeoxyribonuclease VII large subunit [Candidatus Marinimicrobia bacterium]|jgi:exodeoxyribonuclease VII large subunit|nr:exodeoxyribonuclease VII large subunit [Candidatus Neomarinimicrobiota bacterium]HIN62127.1 exodeoxyribonuclease VII large subunit [Candidatus Neomarinimicrobiota bacterium]